MPAQTIALAGNRAMWPIPKPLWDAYVQEALKRVGGKTTFSGNLYYRVRLQPPAATTAEIWPPDAALKGESARRAPSIGILPLSASPSTQVPPDPQAINALGGLPFLPTYWTDYAKLVWERMPHTTPEHQTLRELFEHEVYQAADLPTRVNLLKLWLFGHESRKLLPALLSRKVDVGSGLKEPVIEKQALKGGKKLPELLLGLLDIIPHPSLRGITREKLVGDVIAEIVDPNGQTNQGGAGTCAPTSMQVLLITVNPAEYARLQLGWLSATGVAELADGTTADVPVGVLNTARYRTTLMPDGTLFTPNDKGYHLRTFSEMAFQGAVVKLGKGGAFPAHDGTEQSVKEIFRTVYRGGLSPTECQTVASALFGVKFQLSPVAWPPGSPTFAQTQKAIAASFATDLAAHPRHVLLGLLWQRDPAVPLKPKEEQPAHMVLAQEHRSGRVLFKNPQFAASAASSVGAVDGGSGIGLPPRRYEDVAAWLESMTDADLERWIYFSLVPDTALT
ncbi:hypothetical protein ACFQV2_20690 [Actinokineospora soli]|uniref:Uncharacterized protein n=1 Tax=Actinokineospora soli TaxID=1048753 RepID=A0ABW2TSP2_9PSEU